MDGLTGIGIVFALILYLWVSSTSKKWKARLARIRKVRVVDARISYMDLRGKRTIRNITIESARRNGPEWLVTAWCHQRKEFFVFHSSRMYEFTDLTDMNGPQEITDVGAYFSRRFSRKSKSSKNYNNDQHSRHNLAA